MMGLSYAAKTDLGKIRETNEDSYLLESWPDQSALLAVVADGMGGRQGGEVASQLAIATFSELLNNPLPQDPYQCYQLLLERFFTADRVIKDKANQDLQLKGMGTTLVACIVTNTDYLHLYAGDCRLYHFSAGNLELPYITQDHSVVSVLLELGSITPEQAATHPMRSMVNSCLGDQGSGDFSVDPPWRENKLSAWKSWNPGDLILLCSDGLHGEISQEQLDFGVEQHQQSPEQLLEDLVNKALAEGGNDNITAIAMVKEPKFEQIIEQNLQ